MTNLDGLNADFRDMLLALCDHGAEFLVVGAYAVSFHGHPRTTGDIDLLVRPSQANAGRVWQALLQFGAPVAALGVHLEDLQKADVVIQLGVPPRRIDLLTGISGVDFDTAWNSRVETQWNGHSVPFLGLDALLLNKRASDRPKDRLDVEELEKRSNRSP